MVIGAIDDDHAAAELVLRIDAEVRDEDDLVGARCRCWRGSGRRTTSGLRLRCLDRHRRTASMPARREACERGGQPRARRFGSQCDAAVGARAVLDAQRSSFVRGEQRTHLALAHARQHMHRRATVLAPRAPARVRP